MRVGGCGFTHEKIRLGTSYRFSYPWRQDFGTPNQITERNYDIINFERTTYNMKCSQRNVHKNANSRATVGSCVPSTVVHNNSVQYNS